METIHFSRKEYIFHKHIFKERKKLNKKVQFEIIKKKCIFWKWLWVILWFKCPFDTIYLFPYLLTNISSVSYYVRTLFRKKVRIALIQLQWAQHSIQSWLLSCRGVCIKANFGECSSHDYHWRAWYQRVLLEYIFLLHCIKYITVEP